MHIVLQSGSNVILKRMNRKYTRQIFLETAERLKKKCHDFTFTTDVIVGFPGETEADFEETLQVIKEIQFAKVHMFPYSERPRTRAATYPNKVPQDVIKQRKQEVLHVSEKVAFELRHQFVGRTMDVLTEQTDPSNPNQTSGHTSNFLPVLVQGTYAPNQMVEVRLIKNTPEGLIGVPVKHSKLSLVL